MVRALATGEQRDEAARISRHPGVIQLAGTEECYLLASLALVVFGDNVEGAANAFKGHDPLENREMMFRIQLIADRLLAGDRGESHSEMGNAR